MRVSKKGKSVGVDIEFWLDDNDVIHVINNDIAGFHINVSSNPVQGYGHPALYRRLRLLIDKANTERANRDAALKELRQA